MNRESERKRLVELILKQTCNHNACENSIDCLHCKFVSLCDEEAEDLANALLDNGIVVPPVKVGDKVYKVGCTNYGYLCGITGQDCDNCPYQNRQVLEGTVLAIKLVNGIRLKVKFNTFTDYYCEDELYFTREEAEKMLKGKEDEGK